MRDLRLCLLHTVLAQESHPCCYDGLHFLGCPGLRYGHQRDVVGRSSTRKRRFRDVVPHPSDIVRYARTSHPSQPMRGIVHLGREAE